VIGNDVFARMLGRFLGVAMIGSTREELDQYAELDRIPSETQVAERRFLYNFFRHVWSGRDDVLEIGPWLGGTSRAMVMGMLANKNYQGGKLFTYDRFAGYHTKQDLVKYLQPAFAAGVISEDKAAYISGLTEWKEVFLMIHQECDYFPALVVDEGELPLLREEIPNVKHLFRLDPDKVFNAVFIDGCKSWFGTKYFMQETVAHLPARGYLIFQDYGTSTCFWLSAFVGIFRDKLELVSYVNDTYTYRVVGEITPDEVASRFPDTPYELGRTRLDAIYSELLNDAGALSDAFTMLNYQLHHAGALAYLGFRDEARERITALFSRQEYRQFRSRILLSLDTPTYQPEGQIHL